MPWPLSSAQHWQQLWQAGESLLLISPWRSDVVLQTLSDVLYPLLSEEQTLWLTAGQDRWLQAMAAKLAPTRLPFAVLNHQTGARQAQYVAQRWQAGDFVAVIVEDNWLPSWLEINADHPADVMLGITREPPTLEPLDLQHLWITPPMPAAALPVFREAINIESVSTLPLNPFNSVLSGYDSLRQLVDVAEHLSYRGPTYWLSDGQPESVETVAEPLAWDMAPFLLSDGCHVIAPQATPMQLLTLVTAGLAITIHTLDTNLANLSFTKPPSSSKVKNGRAKSRCGWQKLMQEWQGQETPPVPLCGQCRYCLSLKKPLKNFNGLLRRFMR